MIFRGGKIVARLQACTQSSQVEKKSKYKRSSNSDLELDSIGKDCVSNRRSEGQQASRWLRDCGTWGACLIYTFPPVRWGCDFANSGRCGHSSFGSAEELRFNSGGGRSVV